MVWKGCNFNDWLISFELFDFHMWKAVSTLSCFVENTSSGPYPKFPDSSGKEEKNGKVPLETNPNSIDLQNAPLANPLYFLRTN